MISDEDVRKLYQNCQGMRQLLLTDPDNLASNGPIHFQFFRGTGPHLKNQHPGACKRHMSIFEKFNIIPLHCFSCYKVVIEPRTVVDLFKLMMVFNKLELINDNVRKCTIERRKEVSGAYKGLIYCDGLDEGMEIFNSIKKIIPKEITDPIVTLKRGCSEYALIYPEYARVEQGVTAMEYNDEWKAQEDLADKQLDFTNQDPMNNSFNNPSYTLQETQVMQLWLQYAATIGDLSYLNISGRALEPFQNLDRPKFQHADN